MPGSPPDLPTTLTKRFECLAALIGQPRSKSGLEEVLDYSRSTLDRAVRDLRDADLVVYEDGVWTPTFLGRCAYHIRSEYLEKLDEMEAASSILESLPPEGPVTCEFLDGVEAHEAPSAVPNVVINRFIDYVEGGRTVCLATPRVILGFGEEFYDRIASSDEYTLELIVPEEIFEQFMGTSPHLVETLLNDPDVELYQAAIPFSFGLWIVEHDHAGIIVFTEHGLSGLLVNDSDAALDWADEQYRLVKREAKPIFRRGAGISVITTGG